MTEGGDMLVCLKDVSFAETRGTKVPVSHITEIVMTTMTSQVDQVGMGPIKTRVVSYVMVSI